MLNRIIPELIAAIPVLKQTSTFRIRLWKSFWRCIDPVTGIMALLSRSSWPDLVYSCVTLIVCLAALWKGTSDVSSESLVISSTDGWGSSVLACLSYSLPTHCFIRSIELTTSWTYFPNGKSSTEKLRVETATPGDHQQRQGSTRCHTSGKTDTVEIYSNNKKKKEAQWNSRIKKVFETITQNKNT